MKGHLLTFFKPIDLLLLIPALTCALANAFVTLALTICLGRIFDALSEFNLGQLTPTLFMNHVVKYVTAIFELGVITVVLHIVMYFCIMMFGEKQSKRAKEAVFRSLLHKDMSWFDDNKELMGVLTSSNRCADDLRRACSLNLAYLVQSIATILCCVIYSLLKCWSLTLVIISGVPLLVLVNQICASFMTKLLYANKKQFETSSEVMHWTFQSIDTVKLFRAEPRQASQLMAHLTLLYKVAKKIYIVAHIQAAASKVFMFLGFVEAIYYAQSLVLNGKVTIGTVMQVFWCCLTGIGSSHSASSLFLFMFRGIVAAKKLTSLISDQEKDRGVTENSSYRLSVLKNEVGLYPPSSRGWISLKNVYFRYPNADNDTYALSNCNMTFSPGRINFVVGKSGSGKSTLASLVLKLYGSPTAGQVTIDNANWEHISKQWLKDNIAYMDQHSTIFNMSLIDNIKLGTEEMSFSRSKLLNVYENCAINEIIDELPEGESTILGGSGRNGLQLSGGQQQRISLARTVSADKHIMILDEPTSALDPVNAHKVMDYIRELAKKRTIILITHDLSGVGPSDLVYVMQEGKVVDHGIYWELQNSSLQSYLDNFGDFSDITNSMDCEKRYSHIGSASSTVFSDKTVTNIFAQEVLEIIEPNKLENRTEHTAMSSPHFYSLFKKIIRTIPRKHVLALGLLDTVACASLNPVFSYGSSQMINSFFSSSTTQPDRIKWLVLVNVFVALDGLFTFGKFILDFESENWLRSLRYGGFKNLISQPTAKFQQFKRSLDSEESFETLLMNNLENSRLVVAQLFSDILTFIVTVLGTVIWCLIMGFKLTLVTLSLFPVFAVIALMYSKCSNIWEARCEARNAASMHIMEDCMLGIKTVKFRAFELEFQRRLQLSQRSLEVAAYQRAAVLSLGFSLSKSFLYLAQGLIMYYGMKLISQGEYTNKQVLTIFSMLIYCIVSLDSIIMSLSQVGNGIISTAKVMEFTRSNRINRNTVSHHTRQDIQDPIESIELENVSFKYPESSGYALENISLSIPGGEITAIVGPSGYGKSTIASLITRIHDPCSGIITVNNIDIRNMSLTSLRLHIGVVPQMPMSFFNGSIMDNILLGQMQNNNSLATTMESVVLACKQSLIHEFIMSLPDGYDTMIGGCSDAENDLLSGGQLQRIGIARALLLKPKALIMDEPTSALDPVSTKGILLTLQHLQVTYGTTIVIITHNKEVAAIAQNIIDIVEASNHVFQ